MTEEQIIHSQALWLDAQCSQTFRWLYYHSGVRPDAVLELMRYDPDSKTRHLLNIWMYQIMDGVHGSFGETVDHLVDHSLSQLLKTPPLLCEALLRRIPAVGNRMGELDHE